MSVPEQPQSSTGNPTECRSAALTFDAVTGRLNEMLWARSCPAKRYIQVRRFTIKMFSSVDSVRTSFDHHHEWQYFAAQSPIDLHVVSVAACFAANKRCRKRASISFRLDRSQIDFQSAACADPSIWKYFKARR
jgi:hypothetical protein